MLSCGPYPGIERQSNEVQEFCNDFDDKLIQIEITITVKIFLNPRIERHSNEVQEFCNEFDDKLMQIEITITTVKIFFMQNSSLN